MVFSDLVLIWVSYSVSNHHVVAIVLQEATLKMGPNLSLKCVMFQHIWWRKKVWKVCEFKCHTPLCKPYRMAWLFCIICIVQTWLHSFFGNLSGHWRDGDVTSAQFKNNLLLYAVQTVEKMVDIFIRDRALKDDPLCRSQYGCWSATSIETSVYDVIYMQLECSWTWWL